MKAQRLIFILFFFIISLAFFYFQQNSVQQKNNSELIIGTAAGYAPFVSINEQGEYEGFDIDVARELAQKTGKRLVIKDLGSMSSLFLALEQEKVDALIWGLSITADRLEKVAMIHYQGEITDSFPLLFWKQIPSGVTSLEDMAGKVVSVEPSSSQDTVLSSYPKIKKLETDRVDDALLNIQYRKSNAAFVEPAIGKKFRDKYAEIQVLDIQLPVENQVQGVGIVVKKNNVSLIKELQGAVEQLKLDGTIAELEKKWDMLP